MSSGNKSIFDDSFCSASILEKLDPITNKYNPHKINKRNSIKHSDGSYENQNKTEKRKSNSPENLQHKRTKVASAATSKSPNIALGTLRRKRLFSGKSQAEETRVSNKRMMEESLINKENINELNSSNSILSSQEKRELSSWGLPDSILKVSKVLFLNIF